MEFGSRRSSYGVRSTAYDILVRVPLPLLSLFTRPKPQPRELATASMECIFKERTPGYGTRLRPHRTAYYAGPCLVAPLPPARRSHALIVGWWISGGRSPSFRNRCPLRHSAVPDATVGWHQRRQKGGAKEEWKRPEASMRNSGREKKKEKAAKQACRDNALLICCASVLASHDHCSRFNRHHRRATASDDKWR